jgi:hypothetical protein
MLFTHLIGPMGGEALDTEGRLATGKWLQIETHNKQQREFGLLQNSYTVAIQ